ncbi:MAG: DUF748 domain-containing protein [Candidatus Omnitrophota bacterium]|jgi:hypothetical protein
MKLRTKIIFIVFAVLVFFFTSAQLFLIFKGRSIIVKQLESFTGKKAAIGSFRLLFPLNLEIKKLDIEGLAKIDYIFVSPSISRLFTGYLAFNELRITRPEFSFEKGLSPAAEVPLAAKSLSAGTPAPTPAKQPAPRLIFKRISVREGRINFIDRTIGPEGIRITVKDINFNLTDLYLPAHSVATNFDLQAKIPWQEGAEEGSIEADGWLNLFKKDMAASVKINDINGVYLYPYYSNWVDLEKARIEKAKLNFTSIINGVDNNLTAECHLELTDIVRRPLSAEEEQTKAAKITDTVLEIFKAMNQGKIVLDFTIRTKMDRPEFGFGNIKMAFEDKLTKGVKGGKLDVKNMLLIPVKLMESTIKGATDVSKAVIDGTFAIGNEVKKSVEDSFKKESKEEEKK